VARATLGYALEHTLGRLGGVERLVASHQGIVAPAGNIPGDPHNNTNKQRQEEASQVSGDRVGHRPAEGG
jgi:hypothetical protein